MKHTHIEIYIIKANGDAQHQDESWDVGETADQSKACDDVGNSQTIIFHPLKCNPFQRNWIQASSDQNIRGRAEIISETMVQINAVKTPYKKILGELKDEYGNYLGAYITALDKFYQSIASITDTIGDYIGDDGSNIFGFIQCKFIGSNLKIILKYLKTALGKDIKTIGICLIVVGCSLALSISSTILLIVVINVALEENQITPDDGQIPEYKINNINPGTRVIQYQ